MTVYSKHTNGCSVSEIKYKEDEVEISFGFMWNPFKKFKIHTEIKEGDGETYLDFSVLDLYRDRLVGGEGCGDFSISKVEGAGILLNFSETKVFIAGYRHYTYYTSDIEIVVEDEEYNREGEIIKKEIDKIDLSNSVQDIGD